MYYALHGLSPGKVRLFSINVLHTCIVQATTNPVCVWGGGAVGRENE